MKIANLLPQRREPLKKFAPSLELKSIIGLLETEAGGALAVGRPDGPVEGVFTENCAVKALRRYGDFALHHPLREIMDPHPPRCDIEETVADVVRRLAQDEATHVLALDKEKPVAFLALKSLLLRRLREIEDESGALRRFIAA